MLVICYGLTSCFLFDKEHTHTHEFRVYQQRFIVICAQKYHLFDKNLGKMWNGALELGCTTLLLVLAMRWCDPYSLAINYIKYIYMCIHGLVLMMNYRLEEAEKQKKHTHTEETRSRSFLFTLYGCVESLTLFNCNWWSTDSMVNMLLHRIASHRKWIELWWEPSIEKFDGKFSYKFAKLLNVRKIYVYDGAWILHVWRFDWKLKIEWDELFAWKTNDGIHVSLTKPTY